MAAPLRRITLSAKVLDQHDVADVHVQLSVDDNPSIGRCRNPERPRLLLQWRKVGNVGASKIKKPQNRVGICTLLYEKDALICQCPAGPLTHMQRRRYRSFLPIL